MGVTDFVFGFGKVTAAAIVQETKEVVYQVLGLLGFDTEQSADKQVGYNGLGLISNPLPPQVIDGISYDCDVVYVKEGDQLVPIAWRDLRLNRAFPAGPKAGTIALAGYGGGFYSLDLTAGDSGSQKANIHVLYCPFDFDGDGVPQKAHTIILDPTSGNESISITHSDGYQLSLMKDEGFLVAIDASTFMRLKPGEFLVQAAKIMTKGNNYLGAQGEVGIPLLAGPASPPSPSVFVSPV